MTISETKKEMEHIRSEGYLKIRELILSSEDVPEPLDCMSKTIEIMRETEQKIIKLLS